MNCFQNRIFALSFTTQSSALRPRASLWIAFRIVSLHYRSQRNFAPHILISGCELLSESYLCIIVHNLARPTHPRQRLWIAFRIVSLHYRSQHKEIAHALHDGCELLSESYLCIIVHNLVPEQICFNFVVNCFQNRIFALSFTTQHQPFAFHKCCELLSESYLCIIVHNTQAIRQPRS